MHVHLSRPQPRVAVTAAAYRGFRQFPPPPPSPSSTLDVIIIHLLIQQDKLPCLVATLHPGLRVFSSRIPIPSNLLPSIVFRGEGRCWIHLEGVAFRRMPLSFFLPFSPPPFTLLYLRGIKRERSEGF